MPLVSSVGRPPSLSHRDSSSYFHIPKVPGICSLSHCVLAPTSWQAGSGWEFLLGGETKAQRGRCWHQPQEWQGHAVRVPVGQHAWDLGGIIRSKAMTWFPVFCRAQRSEG